MKIEDWKMLRKKRGFTLREVEDETGISNAYLSQLETGKIKKPSFDIVKRLNEFYSQPLPESTVCLCPNCKSDNVKDASVYESNGVYGPGGASWKTFDAMVCDNCGIFFKQLPGNGIPNPQPPQP